MAKDVIGGRPVDITKESDGVKIVFHPMAKNATKPDAVVFSIKLTKTDLEKLKSFNLLKNRVPS